MSIEILSIVALSVMLFALTAAQGTFVVGAQGLRWGLGSRDEVRDQTVLQGRMVRTIANHRDGMLIYIPLMALVIALGLENGLTALAAWLVIAGRLAFIPLYLGGVFFLRTLVFGVFVGGVILTLLQLF